MKVLESITKEKVFSFADRILSLNGRVSCDDVIALMRKEEYTVIRHEICAEMSRIAKERKWNLDIVGDARYYSVPVKVYYNPKWPKPSTEPQTECWKCYSKDTDVVLYLEKELTRDQAMYRFSVFTRTKYANARARKHIEPYVIYKPTRAEAKELAQQTGKSIHLCSLALERNMGNKQQAISYINTYVVV